jgi:hypothetical protein
MSNNADLIRGKLLIDNSCEYAKSKWLDYYEKTTSIYGNECSFRDCTSLADQVGQFNLKNCSSLYSYIYPICSTCSLLKYDDRYYDLKGKISLIKIEYSQYCKFCISTIDQLLKSQ